MLVTENQLDLLQTATFMDRKYAYPRYADENNRFRKRVEKENTPTHSIIKS